MHSESDNLTALASLASDRHVGMIRYQKPSEKHAPLRWVEPYRLVQGQDAILVRCFQVRSDEPKSKDGWKLFRADRIALIEDTGETFAPRARIILTTREIEGPEHPGQRVGQDPQAVYFSHLQTALMDGILTEAEAEAALRLQRSLSPARLRGVHGMIYANVLQAMLVDGELSDAEVACLEQTRGFLDVLGWAP